MAIGFAAASWAQSPPPRAAYSGLPDMASVAISADGTRIAALRPHQGRSTLVIYDVDDLSRPVQAFAAEQDNHLSAVRWAGEDYVLVQSRGTEEFPTTAGLQPWTFVRWISVNAETGRAHVLLSALAELRYSPGASVVSVLPDDPDHILMQSYYLNFMTARYGTRIGSAYGDVELALYRANLNGSRGRRMDVGEEYTIDIIVDSNGNPLAREDFDLDAQVYEIRRAEGGRWPVVLRRENEELPPFSVIGLAVSGDELIAYDDTDSEFARLVAIDLQTGAVRPVPVETNGHDITGIEFDPYTGRVVGYSFTDDRSRERFFDPNLDQLRIDLHAALDGRSAYISSWSRDRSMVVVYSSGVDDSGSYYLFDANARTLDLVGLRRPFIAPDQMGLIGSADFVARDGRQIPAYLTLPPGRSQDDRPFPTVIMPHGGPEARDTATFDWMAQFFASRGYAVLQPNFRGSSGYGQEFRDAGYGEFGGAMIDDIADSALSLIDEGVVDRDRMCAVGGSYGGYAVLELSTRTELPLRCVVSINGVTDLQAMIGRTVYDNDDTFGTVYWRNYIGDRFEDNARMSAWSPAHHPDNLDAAVLLIHSINDYTVPIEQSEQLRNSALERGRDIPLIRIPGDDHYLAAASSRDIVLREAEEFLAQHLQ